MALEAAKKHNISARKSAIIFSTSRRIFVKIGKNNLSNKRQKNVKLAKKLIKQKALENPDYGYRMITASLKLDGNIFNHKKVYKLYTELNLNLNFRRKKRRKIPARKRIYEIAQNQNEIWSLDFVHNSIKSKNVRTINIIDEFNREVLDIKASNSLPSQKVIDVLEEIIKNQKRKPSAFRIDNGTEFTSEKFINWANENKIDLLYIQPGKPYQNCYIERFNGTYRNEVLNRYIFNSIEQLQQITDEWIFYYNNKRPHSSLNGLPPKLFTKIGGKSLS